MRPTTWRDRWQAKAPGGIFRVRKGLVNDKILEIARRLSHQFDLDLLLEQIVETGRAALHADRASVLLLDRDTDEFYSQATSDGETLRFPANRGIAGETLRSGILRIDDCYADKRFNPEVDRQTGYRTKNMISVALVGVEDEAVGVMQLLNAERGQFREEDEELAETFAGFAAMAIQRAQATEDRVRKAKLERDLDVARQIQMALLPTQMPSVPGYELATYFEPADETGGDLYDLFPVRTPEGEPDQVAIMLADATGHGIGAAVSVTQVRSMLRVASRLDASLQQLCLQLNNQLEDDLPSGKFVTAFFGRLTPELHELHYLSMGQAPLLHYIAAEDRLHWMPASSVPMGLLQSPPLPTPEPIRMAPGDAFVLLSDGFYEQNDTNGAEMGTERVGAIVRAASGRGATALVDQLCSELHEFARGAEQADDLTAVVLVRSAN